MSINTHYYVSINIHYHHYIYVCMSIDIHYYIVRIYMYIHVYIYNNVCTHTHIRIHRHRKIAKSLYKLRQSHTMRVNTWRHFKLRHPCCSRGCRTIKIARFQPMRTMKRCRIHLWSRDHDHFFGGNRDLGHSFSIQSLNSSLCHPKQTMGWFQLVGSIKLLVYFAKEPYKRDYILQKRPIILSILLIIATAPHICITVIHGNYMSQQHTKTYLNIYIYTHILL